MDKMHRKKQKQNINLPFFAIGGHVDCMVFTQLFDALQLTTISVKINCILVQVYFALQGNFE